MDPRVEGARSREGGIVGGDPLSYPKGQGCEKRIPFTQPVQTNFVTKREGAETNRQQPPNCVFPAASTQLDSSGSSTMSDFKCLPDITKLRL